MVVEVRLIGADEIARKFEKLSKEGRQKVAQRATSKMAKTFKQELLNNAPVRTGNLKRHIRQSVTKGKKFEGYYGKAGLWKKRGKGGKDFPFYAYFVEKGTSGHAVNPKNGEALAFDGGTWGGVDIPDIPANPFVRKTFNSKKGAALRIGSKTFLDQIRKLWK